VIGFFPRITQYILLISPHVPNRFWARHGQADKQKSCQMSKQTPQQPKSNTFQQFLHPNFLLFLLKVRSIPELIVLNVL
jgi:hypothetical protein